MSPSFYLFFLKKNAGKFMLVQICLYDSRDTLFYDWNSKQKEYLFPPFMREKKIAFFSIGGHQ